MLERKTPDLQIGGTSSLFLGEATHMMSLCSWEPHYISNNIQIREPLTSSFCTFSPDSG